MVSGRALPLFLYAAGGFVYQSALSDPETPDWLRPLIESRISDLIHYPDPDATELVEALAALHRIPADQILVGNGATELLHLLPRALGCSSLLLPIPSYADYEEPARLSGLAIEQFFLSPDTGFVLDPTCLVPFLKPAQLVLLGQHGIEQLRQRKRAVRAVQYFPRLL